MPHEPGHNSQYVLRATNEPYSGRVVFIGDTPYSTNGGGIEGIPFGRELITVSGGETEIIDASTGFNSTNMNNTQPVSVSNPVVRTFLTDTLYYRQNGTLVSRGTEAHEHQDGTIMLGHDPNEMGEIITRTKPQPMTPTNQMGNNTRTSRQSPTRVMSSRTPRSGGGGGGY